MQVNDAMLKEDRRWLSDRQRLNATFSQFIKRMEALVSIHPYPVCIATESAGYPGTPLMELLGSEPCCAQKGLPTSIMNRARPDVSARYETCSMLGVHWQSLTDTCLACRDMLTWKQRAILSWWRARQSTLRSLRPLQSASKIGLSVSGAARLPPGQLPACDGGLQLSSVSLPARQ